MSGFGSFISGALDSASAQRKAAQEEQRLAERRYADAEFTKKLEVELMSMKPVGFKDMGDGTKAAVNSKGEVIGPPVALSEKERLTGKLELLTTSNALEDAGPERRSELRAAEKAESESVIGARKAQAASSYASAAESGARSALLGVQAQQIKDGKAPAGGASREPNQYTLGKDAADAAGVIESTLEKLTEGMDDPKMRDSFKPEDVALAQQLGDAYDKALAIKDPAEQALALRRIAAKLKVETE